MKLTKLKDIKPEPSLIEYKKMRFLITDRPSDVTILLYLQALKKYNVCTVVRVCECSYDTAILKNENIEVRDLAYHDGTFPPPSIIDGWFELLREKAETNPGATVAVHCVAGLGRAPVMVAMALMELGMKYDEAVETIRDKRRGAINEKQLSYLENYRPKSRLKKRGHQQRRHCCVQ